MPSMTTDMETSEGPMSCSGNSLICGQHLSQLLSIVVPFMICYTVCIEIAGCAVWGLSTPVRCIKVLQAHQVDLTQFTTVWRDCIALDEAAPHQHLPKQSLMVLLSYDSLLAMCKAYMLQTVIKHLN